MDHCRAPAQARIRGGRNRSTALTRLTGVAIQLMAGTVWPMAVLAADPAVETQNNAVVVFTVIVLLFGSMAVGLLFASPLRRRLGSAAEGVAVAETRFPDVFGGDFEVRRRAQRLFEPSQLPTPVLHVAPVPAPTPQQTATPPPPHLHVAVTAQPVPVQAAPAAQRRPTATPWSTGRPQPDANWNPKRRRATEEAS